MMKKILLALIAAMVPVIMSAQAQIVTKKVKIEDFAERPTKVVLTGNAFYDSSIKEEVRKNWTISAYEFCTLEEFNSLKTDDNYYFLLNVKGQFRREAEPGLEFLSVVKGGRDAEEGINKMLELITFPYAAADSPTGRETVFLPLILNIMQSHILASQEKDIVAYGSLGSYSNNLSKVGEKTVLLFEEDMSSEVTPVVRRLYFKNGIEMTDEDTVDDCVLNHSPDTVVSYVVVPSDAHPGSFCYKMLIDTGTGELMYFRKHRITKKVGPGFLLEDIKRISESKK